MENSDSNNSHENTTSDLDSRASKTKAGSQSGKPKGAGKKSTDKKKWSLYRHWKRASKAKRLQWVAEGLATAIACGVLGNYVWQNLQTKWNFTAEHRPKVILIRPPELIGTLECYVTDKAIHLHTGAMKVYIKNIRAGDASGAFPEVRAMKLVPNKKVDKPSFDDLPTVNDDTCKQRVTPKMKMFPVRGGEEISVQIVQTVETVSLINTKSVSIAFGAPQPEPETPPGEKEERTYISKDALFQLYGQVCVHYFGEDGTTPYASCRDYRFNVAGRQGQPDPYSFSCIQTPISGKFEEMFFGYCEN